MIPVMQTRLHGPRARGNCWSACAASILEMSIAEVPDIHQWPADEWFERMWLWSRDRGWELDIIHPEDEWQWAGEWLIAAGWSPRGAIGHAVVWKDGEVAHDPHPEGGGLAGEPVAFYAFMQIGGAA